MSWNQRIPGMRDLRDRKYRREPTLLLDVERGTVVGNSCYRVLTEPFQTIVLQTGGASILVPGRFAPSLGMPKNSSGDPVGL